MKRTISVLLIIASLALMLVSCGDEKKGTSSKISEFQKFRDEFHDSEVYKTAHKFVSDIIETVYKTKEYDVAIEPKSISSERYEKFTDLKDNAETRIAFFDEYALTVTISCTEEGIDIEAVCQQFVNSKLTGELYDPMTSRNCYYTFSGKTGKFEKVMVPEV